MPNHPARLIRFLAAAALLSIACEPALAGIIYVKKNAAGSGDGSSWNDAMTDLAAALSSAAAGDSIWVAAGVYEPTVGSDRAATFQLASGVSIYGGFAGNETAIGERYWAAYRTVLSGDIGAAGDRADNSYHVVTGSGADSTAVLDGVTIAGGEADGPGDYQKGAAVWNNGGSAAFVNVTISDNRATGGAGMCNVFASRPRLVNVVFSNNAAVTNGGGMLNSNSSVPALTGVVFSENSAAAGGGGMYSDRSSSPTLEDVTFAGNHAKWGGGMYNKNCSPVLAGVVFSDNTATYGGGMWSYESSPVLDDVIFAGNYAVSQGGGMSNESHSSPTVRNAAFVGNRSYSDGGGMYNETVCSPTLVNVFFSENEAENQDGGGMYNVGGCSPVVVNTIFSGNSARDGAGIFNYGSSPALVNVTMVSNAAAGYGGGMSNAGGAPTLVNSIVWDNSAAIAHHEIDNNACAPAISYSILKGSQGSGEWWDASLGTDGGHNLDVNPLFVDPVGGNLHLGGAGSPAVDAGNAAALPAGVTTDFDGHPRVVGGAVDLGAYELQTITAIDPFEPAGGFDILCVAPNPFNPSASIRFTLPASAAVTAEVWSVTGARVRLLARSRPFGPGEGRLVWDGRNDEGARVASGVYFVRVETPFGTKIARAVLLE